MRGTLNEQGRHRTISFSFVPFNKLVNSRSKGFNYSSKCINHKWGFHNAFIGGKSFIELHSAMGFEYHDIEEVLSCSLLDASLPQQL